MAYDSVCFLWPVNVEDVCQRAKAFPEIDIINSPAQPACKKNVMVDKFFAPRSTLGFWLTSSIHQLKSMWMAEFCSHRHCLTSPFLLHICVTP